MQVDFLFQNFSTIVKPKLNFLFPSWRALASLKNFGPTDAGRQVLVKFEQKFQHFKVASFYAYGGVAAARGGDTGPHGPFAPLVGEF